MPEVSLCTAGTKSNKPPPIALRTTCAQAKKRNDCAQPVTSNRHKGGSRASSTAALSGTRRQMCKHVLM
jgi:hypothetical protein